MSISERCCKGSPLIDVCPRLSKIDIVTKDKDSKKTVYDFLKDNLSIEVTVEKRKPILEDAYIYQSYLNRLQKKAMIQAVAVQLLILTSHQRRVLLKK